MLRFLIAFPIQVLAASLRGALYYVALVVGTTIFLIHQAQLLVDNSFSALLDRYEEHETALATAASLIDLLCWLPAVPFLLVAIILPACLTFRDGFANFSFLMRATPSHVRVVSYTTILSLRTILFILIPALAMLILYLFFARTIDNQGLGTLYVIGTAIVGLVSLWKAFPFFFSPIFAITSGLNPVEALPVSQAFVRPFIGLFGIISVLGGGLIWGIYLADLSILRYHPWERPLLSGGILWYTITMLTGLSLQILVSRNTLQASNQANIDSSQMSSRHSESNTSSDVPQQGNVIVTRAWVND